MAYNYPWVARSKSTKIKDAKIFPDLPPFKANKTWQELYAEKMELAKRNKAMADTRREKKIRRLIWGGEIQDEVTQKSEVASESRSELSVEIEMPTPERVFMKGLWTGILKHTESQKKAPPMPLEEQVMKLRGRGYDSDDSSKTVVPSLTSRRSSSFSAPSPTPNPQRSKRYGRRLGDWASDIRRERERMAKERKAGKVDDWMNDVEADGSGFDLERERVAKERKSGKVDDWMNDVEADGSEFDLNRCSS